MRRFVCVKQKVNKILGICVMYTCCPKHSVYIVSIFFCVSSCFYLEHVFFYFLPRTGNVEILHDLKWGNICDDEWDQNEGKVICQQLGFIGFEKITHSGYFGTARRKSTKQIK